jgi:hypothetical protein
VFIQYVQETHDTHLEVDDFERFRAHLNRERGQRPLAAEMGAGLIVRLTDPATGLHRRLDEVFHLS